jgi:predicted transposase/invertase (TIGR01784 family)
MPNAPKPDIQSLHDGFTRELFSRLDIATDFLRHYLPPEIVDGLDLSTVEKRKDTFVDEELRRHFSDLVFKVGLKTGGDARVIILVDHKSGVDKWAALQLLRYEVQIWQEEKNDNAETLPVIIPVVLYHGRKP